MARRVYGYCRVSSEEQTKGGSLKDQRETIARHASVMGLKTTRIYEEAESGAFDNREQRTQLDLLIADVRKGDLILAYAVDRFSRSLEETLRETREILARGVSMFFIRESIDPATPQGQMMLSIFGGIAENEHARIKERMVGARRRLRNAGFYADGLAPVGYVRPFNKGYKGPDKNVLQIEETGAALVRQMFDLCIVGKPLRDIAKELGISRDLAADTLSNRIYLGELRDAEGVWIKGRHKAIITPAIFAKAQKAKAGRAKKGRHAVGTSAETGSWILRDVARCAICDGKMGAAYAGPHSKRRYYYKCSKGCKGYVNQRSAEEMSLGIILKRLVALQKELTGAPKVKSIKVDWQGKRLALEKKRQRILENYEDGRTDKKTMLARVEKVDEELRDLVIPEDAPLDEDTRKAALGDTLTLLASFSEAAPEVQREIVGHLSTACHLSATKGKLGFTRSTTRLPVFTWRKTEDMPLRLAHVSKALATEERDSAFLPLSAAELEKML